jgi:hypothetical protein
LELGRERVGGGETKIGKKYGLAVLIKFLITAVLSCTGE